MKIVNLLAVVLCLGAVCAQGDEPDSEVEAVSNFLVKIIAKYDESGAGAIPVARYPNFLAEVFTTGLSNNNPQANPSTETESLLLEATTAFTTKYNGTEVGIQQFYTDLLKDFTVFLIERQDQYSPLLDTYFQDTPDNFPEKQHKQPEYEEIEL